MGEMLNGNLIMEAYGELEIKNNKFAKENTILKCRTDEALNLIGQTKILPMTPQEFSRYEMKLRKTLKGEDK